MTSNIMLQHTSVSLYFLSSAAAGNNTYRIHCNIDSVTRVASLSLYYDVYIWKQWTFHEYLESTAHLGWKQSAPPPPSKLGSDPWHNITYTSQNNFKSSSTTQNWQKLQHATILSCWRHACILCLSKNSYLHDSAHEFLHFWWFRIQILENDRLVETMPSIHTIIIGLFKNIC